MTTNDIRSGGGIAAAVISAVVMLGTPASAQTIVADSLDQLRMIVRLGDTVTVSDSRGGRPIKGTLADLSSSSLVVVVDGTRQAIALDDVTTVRQRRMGSPATGAKIGMATGATFGLLGGLAVLSECRGCGTLVAIGTAVYGGIGAGIGAGVAALTRHDELVYSRPSASAGVTVSPFAAGDRRGVAVSLGF